MHILLGLLAVLAAIGVWIWRARMAADTTREVIGVADDVAAAVRRYGYKRQSGRHPADLVEDARLAAAGMMAAVARMDGDLTRAQTQAIGVEARAVFRVDQSEANDIAAYGRWLAGQSQTPEDAMSRLARRLGALTQSADERGDVIRMLERIAAVEGAVNDAQRAAIDGARRALGLV